ncbi:MAG: exodeoxyribonuclease VII small subunit [Aquihabitans sp.]
MSTPTPVDQLSYPDALAELERILDRLEHDEPDVDRVADDVARATELIAHCRSRISAARIKVDQVVAGLVPPSAGVEGPDADGSDAGSAAESEEDGGD